jgi:hypothetical protein
MSRTVGLSSTASMCAIGDLHFSARQDASLRDPRRPRVLERCWWQGCNRQISATQPRAIQHTRDNGGCGLGRSLLHAKRGFLRSRPSLTQHPGS